MPPNCWVDDPKTNNHDIIWRHPVNIVLSWITVSNKSPPLKMNVITKTTFIKLT